MNPMRKKNQFDPNHGKVVGEPEPAPAPAPAPAPPPAPKVVKKK
jgi:hypothetical protein